MILRVLVGAAVAKGILSRCPVDFSVIAVAIDFSPSSLAALRRARSLASAGSTLRLVHVVDTVGFSGDGALDERLVGAARKELEVLAEEPRVEGARVELSVRVGRPADEILAAAEGASLLVVGTQGRGVVGRLILGSVAEEVARRSVAPVLVVHGADEEPVTRILVAVDPTGPSTDGVRAAAALARRLGARLEAIHAVHLPPVLPYADPGALDRMNEILETRIAQSPELVKGLIARVGGIADVKVHVVTGAPAHEVAREARPGDIVVCGTHGRNALGRLLFGSVAAKLIRAVAVPLLVVRPAEDAAETELGRGLAQRA